MGWIMDKELQEQFKKLDKRFDIIDKRFDGIGKRFDTMDVRFDGMDKRFEGVDDRFESMDKSFKEELKRAVAPLATREDVQESTEELARIIANTVVAPMEKQFEEIKDSSEIRKDVRILKADMVRIKGALHIS